MLTRRSGEEGTKGRLTVPHAELWSRCCGAHMYRRRDVRTGPLPDASLRRRCTPMNCFWCG